MGTNFHTVGKVWEPNLTNYEDETHSMGNVWGNPYFSHTVGISVSHTMGKVWVPKLTTITKVKPRLWEMYGKTQTFPILWEFTFPILWERYG